MTSWLGGLLMQPAGLWLPAGHALTSPSAGLMAVAAIALTAMAIALLSRGGAVAAVLTAKPLTSRTAALCEKSWSAAFQRQLNPDAAGRARPRAPSAAPAAA
jgi:hypothetical protein